MGISDKMSRLADQVQDGVKNSSKSLAALSLKLMTAFLIALTLSLIGQELLTYGSLLFVFVMLSVGAVIFRLLASWTLGSVLIFDLICMLMALLLRMYILVAP